MNNKPLKINRKMEHNKENVQTQQKKLTLKKVAGRFALVILGAASALAITDFKGCRTTAWNAIKDFAQKKTKKTATASDELPKTEPTQAREYRQNYNNRGYQQNRRPQWNNN